MSEQIVTETLVHSPTGRRYAQQVKAEISYFQKAKGPPPLPEAFHYWTNKYLRPEVERVYGTAGVVTMYAQECAQAAAEAGSGRFLSIGSGRGDMEMALAQKLLSSGLKDFHIDCVEITTTVQGGAAASASESSGKICHFCASRPQYLEAGSRALLCGGDCE